MRRRGLVLTAVLLASCNSILGNGNHYLAEDAGAGTAGATSEVGGDTGARAGAAGQSASDGGSHASGGTKGAGTGGEAPVAGAAGTGASGETSNGGSMGEAGFMSTGGTNSAGGSAGRSSTGGGSSTGGAGGSSSKGGSSSTGGASVGGSSSKGGSSSVGGSSGSAGSTSTGPLPVITGGTVGVASRYWDCCKPTCASPKVSCNVSGTTTDGNGVSSACAGGSSFACYDLASFADPVNPYVAYAFASSNAACGACYELQFTGQVGCSAAGSCSGSSTSLAQKTLFIQVLSASGGPSGEIDLLIPGGGVGAFNACQTQWGASDLGSQYGGYLTECDGNVSCTQTKCNTAFSGKADLLAGCSWFLGWFTAADNPEITFKQVTCPSQLSQKSGL